MSELGKKFAGKGRVDSLSNADSVSVRAGSGIPKEEIEKLMKIAQGEAVLATEMTPFLAQALDHDAYPITKLRATINSQFEKPEKNLVNSLLRAKENFMTK